MESQLQVLVSLVSALTCFVFALVLVAFFFLIYFIKRVLPSISPSEVVKK